MNNFSKTLLGFGLLLYCTITTSVLFPNVVSAETVLFEDNFDDGDAADWFIVGNSGWNVNNGQYGIFLNPGLSNSLPLVWNDSNTSIAYDLDIIGNQGEDRNILIKFKDTSNFLEVHANSNGIFLDKASTSGGGGIQGSNGITLLNGITYHFRIEVENNQHIKVFLNNVLIIETDEIAPLITNWVPGLRAGTGGTPVTEVWFDNVKITTLDPTPSPSPSPTPTPAATLTPSPTPTATPTLPSLTVPDIKQYSSPWKNHIYDSALRWTTKPTIERWGCALTSASMILKFWGHGDYANPDSLNNWLRTQPDGYLGDGFLNWVAVTRFSLIHSTSTIPALEYKRLENSGSNLISELVSGRPAVLKVPGHFVVAKGQTSDSFQINDPGHNDRPTLASYDDLFSALHTFTPTHTDLSYLLLTIDPTFTFKVFDEDGNEIVGNTYIEEPLIDDVDNVASKAKSLKIFMLAKPEDNKYTVEVSGKKGVYNLVSYVYNEDGKVNKSTKDGHLSKNTSKDKVVVKTSTKKKKHYPTFPWPSIPLVPWR